MIVAANLSACSGNCGAGCCKQVPASDQVDTCNCFQVAGSVSGSLSDALLELKAAKPVGKSDLGRYWSLWITKLEETIAHGEHWVIGSSGALFCEQCKNRKLSVK